MARLVPDLSDLDEEQQAFLRSIVSGPRGRSVAVGGSHGPPHGLFGALLHNPGFGEKVQKFGAYIRYGTSLPLRLSELAILVCARHWMAQYEYWAHAPIALEAGLPPVVVDSLRTGATPKIEDEGDAAVLDFSRELLGRGSISQPVYERARAALGTKALIELVGVLGYYSLVALMVKAFEIDVPDPAFEPIQ